MIKKCIYLFSLIVYCLIFVLRIFCPGEISFLLVGGGRASKGETGTRRKWPRFVKIRDKKIKLVTSIARIQIIAITNNNK